MTVAEPAVTGQIQLAARERVYTLTKSARFEAAHYLPNVPRHHKCERVHGHSYTVTAELVGNIDVGVYVGIEARGWVFDLGRVGELLGNMADLLDHRTLNDIPGLENPTSEILCAWFWEGLVDFVPGLTAITVAETSTTSVTMRCATTPPPAGQE